MRKNRLIIVGIVIFLIVLTFILVLEKVYQVRNYVFPEKITKTWEYSKTIPVNREEIFCSTIDVQNYPNVLPNNIRSVTILNQTKNKIFAEETITEAGLKTTLFVSHTIKPFDEHILEIHSGDAKGTTIKTIFENINSETKITTYVEMQLGGILVPFGLIPTQNLEHATSTVISAFEDYVKSHDGNG